MITALTSDEPIEEENRGITPLPRPLLSFAVLVVLLAVPLSLVIVIGYLPAPITPNANFFTLSIDGTPEINVAQWTLEVDGYVSHPLNLTYENLTAQPSVSEIARLQCVSGPFGTAN
jgi:DMSO/TMAO reductase YedYZ molybdopterin-dependent catalytic subunit